MRIGIFGGSFDPIHIGHLWVAEAAREHLSLDIVRFIPTAISPLKADQVSAHAKQRLEMLQLAIGGNESFVIDPREVARGGISYTVDTLRELISEQPEAEWFLIVGADSLNDFPRWREPETICQIATVSVVARAGMPAPNWDLLRDFVDAARLRHFQQSSIETPLIEISSRELRSRIVQGRSIRYRVPRAVECFIEQNQIYRADLAEVTSPPLKQS